MKKTLAMALGAMMLGGMAASAEAASHVDFSGYYRVNYMIDNNRAFTNKDATFTDHYFDDRLLIDMTYSPTDEISVHWQLRGPNRDRWGTGTTTNLTSQHIYGLIKQDWGQVLVGRLDDGLDVYGLASLGYQPSFGPYLNYGPFDRADVIDAVRYTNRWDNGLAVMVQYAKVQAGGWDPDFQQVYDSTGNLIGLIGPNGEVANGNSDEDFDRYQAEVSYFWDGGGASLGIMYDRDAASGYYHGTALAYDNGKAGKARRTGLNDRTSAVFVNPAFMQTWDAFSLHFEGMAGWGSTVMSSPYRVGVYDPATNSGVWLPRTKKVYAQDSDGYGAYLDIDYNYGPGNVNLAAWWVSGSDLGDKESGSLVDIVGGNFYPLLVAYGGTGNGNFRSGDSYSRSGNAIGIANDAFDNFIAPAFGGFNNDPTFLNDGSIKLGEWVPATAAAPGYYTDAWGLSGSNSAFNHGKKYVSSSFNENTDANHWAVSISGNHAVTEEINIHYAVAYLALNNPNYRVVDSASYGATPADDVFKYKEQDKDLGYEANIGIQLQLLDRLSFTTSFGYMMTGDAYKELRGYTIHNAASGATGPTGGESAKAKWRDADDVYVWYNTLQFDF